MLEEAAAHAHLSATYFSELFRQTLGLTFQQYLQQLRLKFAHNLLRSTMLPVTEVCHVAGFNTLTHFERVYRKQYSKTPRETRKLGKKAGSIN
ncbi:helix-turn-helix transcriptional regulator [Paenibacillus lignilyticus]|uniref:Helix-turn-helix transcriptional regulator n=1 Tax=Paenibacillus lignilyticus TaxID=1172615 RepID=A0ABS5C780_9BACL|nr:helix-turn-helix transcriptional regulator [Paenibacillus lignilyticus]MBP3961847.1 helix-turn-helix transcriptional regulator [Paenibacillus lignilyticus]MBP3963482.1 helix-turn-helix transcriptional regulator [Paenibacillus lignilyticus]